MKTLFLIKDKEDYTTDCYAYASEFNKQHPDKSLTIINDDIEIDRLANLYGVSELPAILITLDDGSLTSLWQGKILPTKDDVFAYLINF